MIDPLLAIYKKYIESTGVSTDTRSLKEGNLFFALKGPSFNGNQYAQKALDAGACGVVIDESEYRTGSDCFLVDNVLEAMQEIARYHRRQFTFPVLGITGSNGKTTTKELIHSVLSSRYKVYATEGNFNNHIGVPLTLLKMQSDLEFCIVEMGTNQPGDIAELCEIAEPNFGLITNIGDAHLEKLKSRQGVFDEKTSLFRSVETSHGPDRIFLNMGDEYLRKHKSSIQNGDFITYDAHGKYSSNFEIAVKEARKFLDVRILYQGKEYDLSTQLVGIFNIENIAAAVAVGLHFQITIDQIIQAVKGYRPRNMRSELVAGKRNEIYLDAYNANPTSMMSSISSFINQYEPKDIYLILGDMLELGDQASTFHKRILEFLNEKSISNVLLIGSEFYRLQGEFPYAFYRDVSALRKSDLLKQIEYKSILIKGSRGVQLEDVLVDL